MLALVEPVEFFPADALEQETQKPTAIRARLALAGLGANTGRAIGGSFWSGLDCEGWNRHGHVVCWDAFASAVI